MTENDTLNRPDSGSTETLSDAITQANDDWAGHDRRVNALNFAAQVYHGTGTGHEIIIWAAQNFEIYLKGNWQ
jgi:hypothetical protein